MVKNLSWKQKFIALYSGQFISLVTSAAVQFGIIWWLTVESNGSALVLTLAGLAGFMPQALIGPIAGAVVDRYSRKWVMILADMSIAIAGLGLFFAIYFDGAPMALVIIVLAVRSVATAFHMPAMQASIPMMAPQEHLTKVTAWGQTIAAISNVAGPALGLAILSVSSIEWVLLVDVVGALIAVGVLLFITIANPVRDIQEQPNYFVEMRQGFVALKEHTILLRLTLATTLVALLYIPLGTYFPLMTQAHFQEGVVQAGMVEMVFAAGLILGGALLGFIGDRFDKIKLMSFGMALMGGALLVSGLLPSNLFYGFMGTSALVGIAGPLFSAPYYAYIQSSVAPELMGRIFGLVTSIALISTPFGYLIAGTVLHYTDVSMLFALFGMVILANALLVLRAKK